MDVNRIKGDWKGKGKGKKGDKGKGKGHHKGKDKGKYKGKGKGNYSKGKGRGFGRGRGKGKGRGKGRGKFGKGKHDSNQSGACHYCGKTGHFAANCRQKQRDEGGGNYVRQANEETQATGGSTSSAGTAAPQTGKQQTSTITSQAAKSASIRQISMFHIGDPPSSFPEVFTIDEQEEDELEIEYFGRILRVEEFSLTCEEEEDAETEEEQSEDELMKWYREEKQFQEDKQEVLHVRTVTEEFYRSSPVFQKMEVIMDSGADLSLAPLCLAQHGKPVRFQKDIRLQDAQGNRIKAQ